MTKSTLKSSDPELYDILINEGHAYEYDGGKKKVFGG